MLSYTFFKFLSFYLI